VPVSALRVEIVAQAWHYSRAVPGTGTILTGPGRAWTVLFRAVPGPAHRVSAKWPSIRDVHHHIYYSSSIPSDRPDQCRAGPPRTRMQPALSPVCSIRMC
jgi:hypothetical protein